MVAFLPRSRDPPPPNKTTADPVSEANTLGFIDYRLTNLDHNPTHHCSGLGRMALRLQSVSDFKGENHKQGGNKPWRFRVG